MTKVLITQSKLDTLAEVIGGKSNTNVPLTVDEMITAADSITGGGGGTPTLETVTKTYTPSTSAVTDTITPSSGYDGIEEVDVTVSAIPIASPYIYATAEYSTENNNRVWKTRGAVSVDNVEGDNEGYINEGTYYGNYYTYDAIPTGTTITPSTSSQTIGGANYMMEGAVTVSAMPSMTLPNTASGTATGTRKATIASSTSTQYINIPTGYNSANAYYQLSPPSAMTLPTTTSSVATGTQKASVTPGTANKYINIPTGYNSSNAYYTVSGDANLVAGNIKSGTTIFGVTGSYTGGGGGSMNVQTVQSTSRTSATTLTSVTSLTCSTSGTYDVYWTCTRSSTSGTWSSRLYIAGTASGSEQTAWSNHVQTVKLTGVTINANQTVAVYVKARGTNYYGYAPQLTIVQTA